jgi:hypothetical protein
VESINDQTTKINFVDLKKLCNFVIDNFFDLKLACQRKLRLNFKNLKFECSKPPQTRKTPK